MKARVKMSVRNAWFGPSTAAEVGARNGLGEVRIRQFWAEEKAAGRLPDGVRPHFADRCKKPAEPVEVAIVPEVAAVVATAPADDAPGIDKDVLPIAAPNPTHEHECNGLLAALRKHHGESWRGLQTMPAQVLKMEIGDKAKGVPPAPPSRRRAREFARVADVYTGALIKRQEVRA